MDLTTKQAFFLFFAIHLPPVEEGEFLLYIMLKCFNTSTIALSLSSGHCGCLLSSFLGKLGLGTSSKSVAAVVELPCKQSILLVATRKFFPTSIPHFLFTCEIHPAFVSVGTKEQPSRQLFQFPREVLSLPRHQQAQGS